MMSGSLREDLEYFRRNKEQKLWFEVKVQAQIPHQQSSGRPASLELPLSACKWPTEVPH